jgi:hypothetical protein
LNKEEGRRKKEEGRRKKEEGRRKSEEGRRKKEEGNKPGASQRSKKNCSGSVSLPAGSNRERDAPTTNLQLGDAPNKPLIPNPQSPITNPQSPIPVL